MYQLKQTVNDECIFTSRKAHSIREVEHVLRVLASREPHIAETTKSGSLVDLENKVVIWSPGDRGIQYTDKNGQNTEILISIVEPD